MTNLVVMNKPHAHIEVSKYLNLKEQGLQKETADSSFKAGHV